MRQYPDHYAFRAGQNLPDKEFRYLRTVIVTAAGHWGFRSLLLLRLQLSLTFQHWAGVSSYTSTFVFAETCVFGKQLPGPIHCGSILFPTFLYYLLDHPFSRSYGVILPSSLTIVLSLTLGFSPRPPVSVSGTGTYIINPRSFSWKFGVTKFRLNRSSYFTITL